MNRADLVLLSLIVSNQPWSLMTAEQEGREDMAEQERQEEDATLTILHTNDRHG